MNLRLVLELKRLGRPMVVALNMADVAPARRASRSTSRGCRAELGVPVVETVGVQADGDAGLLAVLDAPGSASAGRRPQAPPSVERACRRPTAARGAPHPRAGRAATPAVQRLPPATDRRAS